MGTVQITKKAKIWFQGLLFLCCLLLLPTPSSASKLLKDPYWRGILINPLQNYANSSDNLHTNESVRSFFKESELAFLHEVVTEFLLFPNEEIWKPIKDVSIEKPFILFHQRKAGGTSLRATLERAGKILNLPYFIPCAGINCDLYTFPYTAKYAIYAGHFKWGTQGDLARFNSSHRSEFSCATNFRHPYSRIESCLYYRFYDRLKGRCVMDLPIDEFQELFLDTDEYGSSCINEPFRVLSGVYDEEVIDNLMHGEEDSFRRHLEEVPSAQRQLRTEELEHEVISRQVEEHTGSQRHLMTNYALEIFKQTIQHLQQCPPVVLEIAESYDILGETIPKLGRVGAFESTAMEKVGSKSRKICDHLEGEYLELVKEYAALEMMLYDAVVRKTLMQIASKYSDYLFHMKCIDEFPKRDYLTLTQSKGTPIALVGINNDDTFNIRTLIEHSMGLYIGSIRSRREYSTHFPGDAFCGKRMIAVFAEISNFLVRPDYNASSSAKLEYYYASSIRKCRRGMIPYFHKAAILSSIDPFFVIWKKLELFDNVEDVTDSLKGFQLPSLQELGIPPLKTVKTEEETSSDATNTTPNTASLRRRQLARGSKRTSEATSFGLGKTSTANNEDEKFEDEDAELHRKSQNQTQSLLNSVTSSIQNKQKTSSNATLTEQEHEFLFYTKYYSLLFDFQTYSWLFRYAYLEAMNQDISILTSRKRYLELLKQNKEIPQFPQENFLFYSIEAVIDGAQLLSQYAKDHSTLAPHSNSYTFHSLYTTQYDASNNAFLHLLQYTNYSEYLQPHRAHCAFSHIKSQTQLGVNRLKDLQAMKQYYRTRPKVLQQVKDIVLQWLAPMNIQPSQLHLLYDLTSTKTAATTAAGSGGDGTAAATGATKTTTTTKSAKPKTSAS